MVTPRHHLFNADENVHAVVTTLYVLLVSYELVNSVVVVIVQVQSWAHVAESEFIHFPGLFFKVLNEVLTSKDELVHSFFLGKQSPILFNRYIIQIITTPKLDELLYIEHFPLKVKQ